MTEVLTRSEVSELLKVPVRTIDYWVGTDQIPYSRCGKRLVRFNQERIEEWLKERENIEFRHNKRT